MALMGNLLATVHKRVYMLRREARNMGNGVLIRFTASGDVAKVRNAGHKAAVALATDHCPVPDPIHVFLPLSVITLEHAGPTTPDGLSGSTLQSQNLSRWSVFPAPEPR